jgi:hypothetical protein
LVPGVFAKEDIPLRRPASRGQNRSKKKASTDMTHKYSMGQNVYYEPTFGNAAARGKYKIVRPLPVENDNRLSYRIKSIAETFERIAEEHQLSRSD